MRLFQFKLLCCILLAGLFSLFISTGGAAGETTAAEPATQREEKQLALSADGPTGPLELGDEVTITIVAANPGAEAVERVLLHLPGERGLTWLDPAGPWLELGDLAAGESRTLTARARIDGAPRSGLLPVWVGLSGHDAAPQRERVVLRVRRARQEVFDVAAGGGEVQLAGGRVYLVFPPGWNEQDARLAFQVEELFRQRGGRRGRLLLFTLEVAAGGAPIDAFDAPVTVELALGDLLDDGAPSLLPPAIATQTTADAPWEPVAATFDPAAGVASFTMTHLAAYQAANDPEIWRPAYSPPGASAYTGSATYSYPIELPPGIGGLTPDLSLNYSSRAAEGLSYPSMGLAFGAGWSLPQAQINNGNSGLMYGDKNGGCSGYGNWRFTLQLNGATYYLQPQDNGVSGERSYGRYEAIGSPELFIEYLSDPGNVTVSGEYWRARTADGTTYTFGDTADAEQVVWPVSMTEGCNYYQPRNDAFSANNWKLSRVEDVHGNRIDYTYATACGTKEKPVGSGTWVPRGENRNGSVFQCS